MAHQVQHCIIGDGLEAAFLALTLLRHQQSVALVQTTQPMVQSLAAAVTEQTPALAALYATAHAQWPQLAGFKPALWRVQGMTPFQPEGGIIHTFAAQGALLKEFSALGGLYLQVPDVQAIDLTRFEGKLTGVTAAGERVNAEKTVLANGIHAHTLAETLQARLPLHPSRCHSVGMAFHENITVPPIAVKLPQGHVYLFSDGVQRIRAIYAGTLDRGQTTWHTEADPAALHLVKRLVAALLPRLTWQADDATPVRVWLDAVSPDGLPLVGRVEGVEGLWVCSGLAEHAAFLAPAVAPALADLLCDRPYDLSLNDMMPARIQRAEIVAAVPIPQTIRGDKTVVDAPALIKGEERFVDGAATVIRGQGQPVLKAGTGIQRGVAHIDNAPSDRLKDDEAVPSLALAPAPVTAAAHTASAEMPHPPAPGVDTAAPLPAAQVDTPGDTTTSAPDEPFVGQPMAVAHTRQGEKKMVAAPQVTRGEEHFVDTSATIIRNTAELVMDEGPKVTHGGVRMEEAPTIINRTKAEPKMQMPSLKNSTPRDKKVTVGSLKKPTK